MYSMADKFTKEERSKVMRAVKSKNSKIELKLRQALWARGLRYRLHYTKLPGKPDIVFVSKQLAVFCDSEFWHGKDWETRKHDHKSNQEFWINKIETNIKRDADINQKLEAMGWKVLRFWGKDILKNTDECINQIEKVFKKL